MGKHFKRSRSFILLKEMKELPKIIKTMKDRGRSFSFFNTHISARETRHSFGYLFLFSEGYVLENSGFDIIAIFKVLTATSNYP